MSVGAHVDDVLTWRSVVYHTVLYSTLYRTIYHTVPYRTVLCTCVAHMCMGVGGGEGRDSS